MRRVALINEKAGTVRRLGRQQVQDLIIAACAEAGEPAPDIRILPAKQLEAALHAAVAEGFTELWVGGGDGTLRTAARLLHRSGQVLGVLPVGTCNLFARDLGLPMDLKEAVKALLAAPAVPVDVGLMNGTPFLNKSALGLYPEMVIDRDRRRRLFGYGKWRAMLKAGWKALRRHRMIEVDLDIDGQVRHLRTPVLIVAINEYEFRPGKLMHRPDLDSGLLTVYVSHEKSWWGSLGQLIKMFLGTLPQDPEMEILRVRHLVINFRHSRPVANDGEVDFLRGPITYEIGAGALLARYPARATQPVSPATAGITANHS